MQKACLCLVNKVLCIVLLSRVARVVAPKKAALKEAEAELAVAMEVSMLHYFLSLSSHVCK